MEERYKNLCNVNSESYCLDYYSDLRKLKESLIVFMDKNIEADYNHCKFCGVFLDNMFRHIFGTPCHAIP